MHVGQMVTDAVDVLACSIDAVVFVVMVVAAVNFPSYLSCIVCIVKYIFGDFSPSTDL